MPLNNISNMTGCFQGGDWGEYTNDTYGEYELDYDYNPFKYSYASGVWTKNLNYSNTPYTYMWEYDGDWVEYDKVLEKKGL